MKPSTGNGIAEIDLIRQKDSEALAEWVHTYHRDVFRFMRHLTRHTETAEDLTQQTFVNAFGAIHRFDGRSTMRVWLHTIAYREYAGWRRRHRLFAPLDILLSRGSDHSEATETRNVLLDAIHRLAPKHQGAFLLNEVQGLSFEEIAEVTGCPVGTLKSRAHYAKQRLQSLLQPHESYL